MLQSSGSSRETFSHAAFHPLCVWCMCVVYAHLPYVSMFVYVRGVCTSTICIYVFVYVHGVRTYVCVCLCMCVVYAHLPYVCVVYAHLPYVCVWCMHIYHMCVCLCMCSAIFLASSFPTFVALSKTQPIKLRPITDVLALVKCRRPSC